MILFITTAVETSNPTFAKYYDDQIKEGEMGRAYCTHEVCSLFYDAVSILG
jgi:hypothetical protein